jgi:hypothetical protein
MHPVGARVAVLGTVTVQPGRILGDRTLVLQDDSGGLAVRLPSGYPAASVPRGTMVQVEGVLAAPYGNLELRPDEAADLAVVGSGGLPEPLAIDSAALAEPNEGLLATLTARVVDIDRYDSGSVSIGVRDAAGDGRVYAFAPIGLDREAVRRGQRIRATGIIGQRASSSGADDGFRLWVRGTADLEVISPPPTTTPPRDRGGGAGGRKPPRAPIGQASVGSTVTISGVVTSKAGLLDADGRRVTVEDRSGAILVRYPSDARPARVGQNIRASGEVGTWYGAPQLEAAAAPRRTGRARVTPRSLSRAPDAEDEWRLVTVRVRVTDVTRSGDTWRVEASLRSGDQLPIIGLAGSGIDPDLLAAGLEGRVTGIVRRAHPAANDQRFAVAPRSLKDIRLRGPLERADEPGTDLDGGRRAPDPGHATADEAGDWREPLAVTLGSLDGLEDRVVRVGGRVRTVAGQRLTIDDGTATASVRLAGAAAAIEPAIGIGEVVNASGRVRLRAAGAPEVVVEAPADLRRAANLSWRPVSAAASDRPSAIVAGLPGGAPLSLPVVAPVTDLPADPGPEPDRTDVLFVLAGLGAAASMLLASSAAVAWRGRQRVPTPAAGRPAPS